MNDWDPAAQELGRRLAALDLAAQCRIRASLRARLLNRPQATRQAAWPRLRWAAAVTAAAIVVFLVRLRPPERAGAVALPRPAPRHTVAQAESVFRALPAQDLFDVRPIKPEDLFVKPDL